MTYYIDLNNGCPMADGLSPEHARLTYTDLDIKPGDTVLFKRGTFIRDNLYRVPGEKGAPVTYGAYGEGTNPVFCGAVDVSDPALWEPVDGREHVWLCKAELSTAVCNFVFDHGRMGATLRWSEDFLCAQGDFHDNKAFGDRQPDEEEAAMPRRVTMYSVGNPGNYYKHIECAVWGRRNLSSNVDHTVVEDLIFYASGVHGLTGGCVDMAVRRCSFLYIGGAVWNNRLRIRFGNAIEFWNIGEDLLIEDCYFNNIYDSAITHQGSAECKPARNFIMRNNLFINYSMGAYEGRDLMSIDSAFEDNLCVNAGGGFGGFGDTKPRNSEIFPQPMGHHLFMWRMKHATEGGSLSVKRNRFYHASGAALFNYICPEADAQMDLADNTYYTENKALFNLVDGKSYAPAEFDAYAATGREPGAKYEAFDVDAAIADWFAKTGCGRFTEQLFSDKLPDHVFFVGSTERDATAYRVGEDMTFVLSLQNEDGVAVRCAKFAYERRADGCAETETGIIDANADGAFVYTTSIDRPGFVHLIVRACDADGTVIEGYDIFEGGACANFDEIRQVGAIPADYDDFWVKAIREELDPVKPEVLSETFYNCGDPGDIVYDLRIAGPNNTTVSAYLRMPRDAEDKSLPIIVGFMGYGWASAPIPPKDRALYLHVNSHSIENGKSDAYYRDLAQNALANFGFDKAENEQPGTVYFKNMILRDLQALRYAKTLPQWDGKNITVCGGSMGAFQPTHVAALDHDVTYLDIAIPWMCDLRAAEDGRLPGWRPEASHGLDYYDTVTAASRVKCPVHIFAGLGDYICPPSGEAALYHAFTAPTSMELAQNRTHPYQAPIFTSYRFQK